MIRLDRAFMVLACMVCSLNVSAGGLKLRYSCPVTAWIGTLPLGNSRLGVMVYDGMGSEELQLNEETVWGGGLHRNNNPKVLAVLPQIRQFVLKGRYREAQGMVAQNLETPRDGMPYQTIGSLILDFPGHEKATDYYCGLDIGRTIAATRYRVGEVTYNREAFISLVDNVIVVRLAADKQGALSFTAPYKSPLQHEVRKSGKKLVLIGRGTEREGVPGAIRVETQTEVKNEGGHVVVTGGNVQVSGVDAVILYVFTTTNFVNYGDVSGDVHRKSKSYLDITRKKEYEQAREAHIAYYQDQFNRMKLDLGTSEEAKRGTHLRVKHFDKGRNMSLATLMSQYGRYLLISSSQPGGQPTNLQGIWNDNLLAPWGGKYTVNINLEMNYQPSEVTNLSETHLPLMQMLKELSEMRRETARTMYGCDDQVLHHNIDIWRYTELVNKAFWGVWPNGGAWLCQHLQQHYPFIDDKAFLKKTHPIIKGVLDPFLRFLVKHPKCGWMVACPSNSPEHGPKGGEKKNAPPTVAGCTMDNQVVFNLFSNTLQAHKILMEDAVYAGHLQKMIGRLPPMQIGRHNQSQEWLKGVDDPTSEHRHMSHFFGLYPSNQISPYTDLLLFQAAKNSLIYRGGQTTGWSIGWKINLWTRLLDSSRAFKTISNTLVLVEPRKPEECAYPNPFGMYSPFQIDRSFGYTTGIAEMLLQSHDNAIHLLLASPDAWRKGRVEGLVTRGGFVTDMEQDGTQLSEVIIYARLGGDLRLHSYVPLKDKSLREVMGGDKNPFFQVERIKESLISKKVCPQYPLPYRMYEYDVVTEPRRSYRFERI